MLGNGRRACLHASTEKSLETRCDVLALRLAEVKAKTVRYMQDNVKAKALVNKFAATLAEMKAETTEDTLCDVELEGLVDRTADTLQEVTVRIITAY